MDRPYQEFDSTYHGDGRMGLTYNDINIDCGFEIGDWKSYVSAGRDSTNAKHRVERESKGQNKISVEQYVDLSSGRFEILQHEYQTGRTITRTFLVSPEGVVSLGDFVIRFSIPKSADMIASIDGKVFEHRGKNRYLQFETDSARIEGTDLAFSIRTTQVRLPNGMKLVTYVRDEPPDTWVIHARAIAFGTGNGFLRLYRGDTVHVPWIDELVKRSNWLVKRLRYLREESLISSSFLPIQYCEWSRLSDNDLIEMTVEGKIEDV